MDMTLIVLMIPIVLVVGWLVAEFKWSRTVRIALGAPAIVAIAVVGNLAWTMLTHDTAHYQRTSLVMIHDLLEAGQVATVRENVAAYVERMHEVNRLQNASQLYDGLFDAVSQLRGRKK